MLVSHTKKFIFVKTAKTASTSVESYFERFCIPPEYKTGFEKAEEHESEYGIVGARGKKVQPAELEWWHHMPANIIKNKLKDKIWEEYLKFCVIRNPYERLVSMFFFEKYKQRLTQKPYPLEIAHNNTRMEFNEWVLKSSLHLFDREILKINEKYFFNHVIRFENLDADLRNLCSLLSINYDQSELPTFKKGIRPKEATAVYLYNQQSIQCVQCNFAEQLEYFGYDFPSI